MAQQRSVMLAVGRVTKSVGIKGELKLAMLTDTPDRFKKLKTVWLGKDESTAVRHTIVSVRTGRSDVVLKLKEIETRTSADEQRGLLVFVGQQDAIKPKQGTYFIHDIVGMTVETESGGKIGSVQEVLEYPANDVWVIRSESREILIPAIKDVILSVDLKGRTVVIRPLEGLVE